MIFLALVLMASLILASSKLSLHILHDEETDQELLVQVFNDLNTLYLDQIDLFQDFVGESSEIGQTYTNPTIVIDITKILLIKQKIKESARIFNFVHITIFGQYESFDQWEYFSHISISNHAQAMSSMLSFLDWNKIGFLYSNSFQNIEFRNALEEELIFNNDISYISRGFGNWLSQDLSDNLISKEIKAKGLNTIIISNEGEGARKLMQSFELKNMYKEGFGVILGSLAIWGPNNDGLVFIVEKGLESAENLNHYHSLSIINLLSNININSDSIYIVKEKLWNSTANQHPLNSFSIVNIQEKTKKIVGYIQNNTVSLTEQIIFPGNSKNTPKSAKPPIVISIASGDTNFNGVVLGSNSYFKIGSFFALMYAKYIHFLDDFNLNLYSTDCSADFYLRPFSYNCLSRQKSNLGVAFLPSYNDNVCYGTISDFRALGIKIPLVSDQCTSEIFTNKTAYPEFMRIMKSFAFHSNTLAYLMSIFNWDCAVVFYENSTFGLNMYKSFSSIANSLGIKIVNDEDKRMLDPLYGPDLYQNYTEYMKNAIKTQCKIIVPLLEGNVIFNLFGQLHDEGIRLGDFIYLLYYPIAGFFEHSQGITNKTRANVKELAYGSFGLWQSEWVGSYGKSLIALGNKFYGYFMYGGTCPAFDAFMLTINGIKYLIDAGEDYEDPDLLNAGLRKVKFMGCSGTVQISSNSNERSSAIISIMNEIYNETLGYYLNVEVGTYSIGSNPPFVFTKNIIWPDNTQNIPGEKRLNPDNCPFNLHLIQDSDFGYGLYYGFVFGTAFIVAALSIIILVKLYWNTQLPMITVRSEITAHDYIIMAMILIDFLQYLAMGPDISAFDQVTSFLYDYAAVNLSVLINFKGNPYWIAIAVTFSVCYLWLFLSLFIYFNLHEWKNIDLFNNIGIFAKFITPIIGNLGFIPITHILLTIFQCEKGIGSRLTESFMNHDCSVFCYEDEHIFFVILSMITLLIYLPLSIVCRPCWQSININANVYSNPSFLVAKSIFQIITVALNKTLKHYSQSLDGGIYFIFVVFFIFFVTYKKPYNYNRCNLWTTISLIALAWSLILSSIYYSVDYSDYKVWMAMQFGGWIIIVVTGILIQRKMYPSLLYSVKGLEISIFFKFAFTKQVMLEQVMKKQFRAYEVYDADQQKNSSNMNSKNEFIDSQFVLSV
ncbi:unnamed protein product [Blepharisma stoltei]|uniref:Receptor ligand binding region domain-containing protein n=1 Tax=Blepharisma stoltei TaxID=1481888 RepID=A0AAU9IP12_9CILI|nr:unnamed protein product [Blepharisma stoltei]